ncbi:MAG: HAD hydrolase-like protein, partial [Gemmataceae bacterium]
MNYRFIVFDFDGTLADSMAESIRIFQQIGPELGLKPFTDLHDARNMPTRKILKEVGVTFWKLPKVVRAFQAAAAERAHELKLHPGLPDALADLHARGAHLGVLSSNREDNIRKCLAANGVEHLFSFVTGHPHLFGKARALRRIRRRHKIERSDLVYVGDETRDVEAAHAAGVGAAAVAWGYHTPELLNRLNPTVLLREPAELAVLVDGSHVAVA